MRMMNKVLALLLGTVILLSCSGCQSERKEVSCQDVIAVYEEAGYEIFHKESGGELDYACYVRATDPQSGEYIFFHFFESEEAAESYADERKWNLVLWLYSLACGEPSWLTTQTYSNIEIEYDNADLYKPFQTLLE